jgi:hypothetical protein
MRLVDFLLEVQLIQQTHLEHLRSEMLKTMMHFLLVFSSAEHH